MARRLSMATRRELKQAIGERYRAASQWERRQLLDEFTRVTGYHRKHALRVLHRPFVTGPIGCCAQCARPAEAHGGAAGEWARRSGRACRCGPLTTGATHRRATARLTWSNTAAACMRAASCTA